MRDQVSDVITFGGFRLEKFPACGDIEEEVPDFEFGPMGKCDVTHVIHPPAADFDLSANQVLRALGSQSDLGYRSDRRESFSAKTECENGREVILSFDLARGMPLEGEDRVIS